MGTVGVGQIDLPVAVAMGLVDDLVGVLLQFLEQFRRCALRLRRPSDGHRPDEEHDADEDRSSHVVASNSK